jgi:hypothetical protein
MTVDLGERLAWKSGRRVAGRDDGDDSEWL